MGNYESFNGSKNPKEYRGTQKSQRKEKGGEGEQWYDPSEHPPLLAVQVEQFLSAFLSSEIRKKKKRKRKRILRSPAFYSTLKISDNP
jgi:hypothetical protein